MSIPQAETGRPTAHSSELEASLYQLIHVHHLNAFRIREKTEKAKKEAIGKAERVSDLMVEAVNEGVQKSFVEQKRIEMEIRSLSTAAVRYKKQTDQWLAASRSINSAIKEIGDFENWMKIMEFDCKTITAAIRNIHNS